MDTTDPALASIINLPVRTLLQRWPQAISLFLKYRMNCVGCYMDELDSLMDALNTYKIPAELFVRELNTTIGMGISSEEKQGS